MLILFPRTDVYPRFRKEKPIWAYIPTAQNRAQHPQERILLVLAFKTLLHEISSYAED